MNSTALLTRDERRRRIDRARAKLVNEEHRLALMKKIRQSQTRPIQQQQQHNQQNQQQQQANPGHHANANPSSVHPTSQQNNSTQNSPMTNSGSASAGLNLAAGHLQLHQTNQPQYKKLRMSQSSSSSSSASSSHHHHQHQSPLSANLSSPAAAAAAAAAQMVSRALHKNSPNNNSPGAGLNLPALAALNSSLPNASISPSSSPQSQLNNPTPAHAHQRSKVNSLWNPPQQSRHPTPVGIAPPHVGNMSRQPITTPPNVVQAMIGNLVGQQQSLLNNQMNSRRNHQQHQQQSLQTNNNINQFNKSQQQQAQQMLMQQNKQRTSSKNNSNNSLQKQIEQTLLQQNPKLAQVAAGLSAGFSQQNNNLPQQNTTTTNKRSSLGISSPHVGNLSRQPITTPPNVVQDMRGNISGGQQSLLMNANNLVNATNNQSSGSRRSLQLQQQQQQQSQLQSPNASPFSKPHAAQLLLQKRSAAKTAIQKQLEQTLTQLPQQKQIQLGIDFLPNANNLEFVYYVGLEACVDYLTNTKNAFDAQLPEKPYNCSTCGTDFTPSWSWKRSQVICENCVGNHVRKSLKSSQANRIKSVLAKAAKQESEIDQKIMAEAASVVSSIPSSSSSPLTTANILNTSNTNQSNQHSLLQQPQPQQPTPNSRNSNNNNNNQSWNSSRSNHPSPLANSRQSSANHTPTLATPPNVQPNLPAAALNPANFSLPPAALASLLQMSPQLATLANNNNNQNNQFAHLTALLMNQITMNLMRR